jgi:hypothetical protein
MGVRAETSAVSFASVICSTSLDLLALADADVSPALFNSPSSISILSVMMGVGFVIPLVLANVSLCVRRPECCCNLLSGMRLELGCLSIEPVTIFWLRGAATRHSLASIRTCLAFDL